MHAIPGYDGTICLGCGADVSRSGKVHTDDCRVFNAQLRKMHEARRAARIPRAPSQ